MISLEQIRILEQKVESALARLKELQNENAVLKHENTELKTQVNELNETCSRFEQEEGKIEQGILHVLNRLNTMEDTVQRTLLSDNQASQSKKEPVQTDIHNTANGSDTMPEQNHTKTEAQVAEEPVQTYVQEKMPEEKQSFGTVSESKSLLQSAERNIQNEQSAGTTETEPLAASDNQLDIF